MEMEHPYLTITTNTDHENEHSLEEVPVTTAVHILPASIKPNRALEHHDAGVSAYFEPLVRPNPDIR